MRNTSRRREAGRLPPSADGHNLMKEGWRMRTYGVSMIYTRNGLVPCIMPYYTAEENNSLERGSRPYTVVEILREVFHEDFEKSIQLYMELCPEGAAAAIGEKEAREFKLVRLSEPKVESSSSMPPKLGIVLSKRVHSFVRF